MIIDGELMLPPLILFSRPSPVVGIPGTPGFGDPFVLSTFEMALCNGGMSFLHGIPPRNSVMVVESRKAGRYQRR